MSVIQPRRRVRRGDVGRDACARRRVGGARPRRCDDAGVTAPRIDCDEPRLPVGHVRTAFRSNRPTRIVARQRQGRTERDVQGRAGLGDRTAGARAGARRCPERPHLGHRGPRPASPTGRPSTSPATVGPRWRPDGAYAPQHLAVDVAGRRRRSSHRPRPASSGCPSAASPPSSWPPPDPSLFATWSWSTSRRA